MPKISSTDISIQFSDETTDFTSFCCTEPKLNEYLTEDAWDDHKNLYSITHLVYYKNTLAGFFTLITDNISIDKLDEDYTDYHYKKLPAVKIARLATDKRFERMGIGELMIREIFKEVIKITQSAGCRIITVDAKDSALGFYKKYTFKEVSSKRQQEYIPMYLDFHRLLQKLNKN